MGNAALELRALAKTNGWKQALHNDHDGVAVVSGQMLARRAAARVPLGGLEIATLFIVPP